ncbi:hypothetical protein [Paenibacillus arenosi]|uniref:Uncharacterized protein n=1 Tax=Paenibacillus arenosi TaxID=2774142 RepID=A0ABR9B1T8_9BACL|nr:hypothetical protein [Paenibacillus arenosi]MBD8500335.1 hypothetical protein [Paenibacillus arenosi]
MKKRSFVQEGTYYHQQEYHPHPDDVLAGGGEESTGISINLAHDAYSPPPILEVGYRCRARS